MSKKPIATASPSTPFRISPSTVARYFFQDCDRFLRFSAATPEQRTRDNSPTKQFDHSPLMNAIFESGYEWETYVLKNYLKKKAKIAKGEGELHKRRFSMAETHDLLRDGKPGTYIYQPTFRPPSSFYARFQIDPSLVTLSDNHPDLISVEVNEQGKRVFRVLDVKRGETLKLTHRVQVLLYALQLDEIIQDQGISDAQVDLSEGAVWLGQKDSPSLFDLDDFRPHLENFLRDDLSRILREPAKDVHWHLYFRCEWCEFFSHCRDEMTQEDNISRVANLTSYGKRHLKTEAKVDTIPQLASFLKQKDTDEILSRCASLTGQRPRLQKQVDALLSKRLELQDAAALAIPKGENIALFLTLQEEPLGKTVYLAGLLLQCKPEVGVKVLSQDMRAKLEDEKGRSKPLTLLACQPEEVTKLQSQWIHFLFKLLTQIDEFNRSISEWKDQVSLQAYIHSEQEKSLLIGLLIDALKKPKLAEKAMTLLFYFQAPELMMADRHPDSEVPYPVVVLVNALVKMFALPVDVRYTLPESLAALGSSFKYSRNDYYHFPFGDGMRAEAIHSVWRRGKRELSPEIRQRANLQLYAISALLRSMRQHASQSLFTWPPKFRLPDTETVSDKILSRLIFFTRYESLLRCLEVRDARSESREAQAFLGQVLELQARDEVRMAIVGDSAMEVDESGFPGWMLVDDDEDGRRAQLEYRDYLWRNKHWGGSGHPHRAIVGITQVRTNRLGLPSEITVDYKKPFSDVQPGSGDRLLLYPRFTDYTTDPIISFLRESVPSQGLFLDLLKAPEEVSETAMFSKPIENRLKQGETQLSLTTSQLEAYRRIRHRKFVPVWGPPGTGKTHFLASIILGLISAHADEGRPFRVLVTAFTHAAIENVLRKLAELKRTGSGGGQAVLGKAKKWHSPQLANAMIVEDKGIPSWLQRQQHAVLGSTVYSILKTYDELAETFDLVVIDEASQVRVSESAVPIGLVHSKGRLVLAGDHLQLPPIIAGDYPDTEPGEPVLHRSIFEAVGGSALHNDQIVSQLSENFRMNDYLTGVASHLLYGPKYQCFDEQVASRRLNLQLPNNASKISQACLDPDFPLVIVALEGIQAARENVIEAELVSILVSDLRQHLKTSSGKAYDSDQAFFKDGVFIVSPHRMQIRTIQQALHQERDWTSLPFVDTVDKMQGQEADAVIVSYGVSDPEFAMQEADFIYGLNRLNVAMTRAKTKCVLFLPRPLLDATPSVLDQPEAARGLAFMRRLISEVSDSAHNLTLEIPPGVKATIYRSSESQESR
ncbi:hypothetical protein DTL21_07830 [Bremerella cremea]|uniref:DNA2/NAM7 helicase-like C-terminal domain-containing protein n=1 Tax=Blastopirellula marina TaxID=124 RepID=A0A2S8G0Q2_9BACT|nr:MULTISPECIES: AAA domain-containing protein [Pirellulaceae]PQO37841.1 hypothetical protein C5Y83_07825 [Blastopirellula marina]RCS50229.1 hypothetical protein DTL21_07830 [Bremerella cremea]